MSSSLSISHVNTLEEKPQYRLGDAILFSKHTYWGKEAYNLVSSAPKHFRNSLLYKYSRLVSEGARLPDWKVLRGLVDNKITKNKLEIPFHNELVVHLRMGDDKGGVSLQGDKVVGYIRKTAQSLGVKRIAIVTALHFGRNWIYEHTRSELELEKKLNLNKINEIISGLNGSLSVRVMSRDDIDADFCFLTKAPYLIIGNGHFSVCAAMCGRGSLFIPPWVNNPFISDEALLNRDNPGLVRPPQ
jgi:hypothetical protein